MSLMSKVKLWCVKSLQKMSLLDMKLHHRKDISKGRDTKGDEQKKLKWVSIHHRR
jgi:hypothetical protein